MNISKHARILTVVSCERGHDHGAVSVRWTWESVDPFALTLHVEGTDEFWQLDQIDFVRKLHDVSAFAPLVSGVASIKIRETNPYALSLRLTSHTESGERHEWLICSVLDVRMYVSTLVGHAPASYVACDVDATIEKLLAG